MQTKLDTPTTQGHTVIIRAFLLPPTSHMYIGGTNSAVFKGTFEIQLPHIPQLPCYLDNVQHVFVGGLNLRVKTSKKARKGKIIWYCNTHLKSISANYFSQLHEAGWVLIKSEAKRRSYPNDARDKELQERSRKEKEEYEHQRQISARRVSLTRMLGKIPKIPLKIRRVGN